MFLLRWRWLFSVFVVVAVVSQMAVVARSSVGCGGGGGGEEGGLQAFLFLVLLDRTDVND